MGDLVGDGVGFGWGVGWGGSVGTGDAEGLEHSIVISPQFQNFLGFPAPVAPVGSYGYRQSLIPEARNHPSSWSLWPTAVFL